MISIKRLASALLLLCCCSVSNAQDTGTTTQLITNQADAWTGCYTPTQQGFWGGKSGGPCPGIWTNNEPYNENQIIFSYGQTTLSQTASLAGVLPNSGTGLRVSGYNYHWHVKNSNINDQQPGSFDSISRIDISLLDANGKSLITDTYDYGYRIPEWIAVSGTRTYEEPYSLTSASSIRLSVTGKDDGYWAGYYGPEFKHFSLTVNYSVDPCVDNPFYSPTCPGFADALAALTESANAGNPVEDTSQALTLPDNGNSNSFNVPGSMSDPTKPAAEVTTDIGGAELSVTGEVVVSTGAPSVEKKEEKKSSLSRDQLLAMARDAVKKADATALSVAGAAVDASMSEAANPSDGIGLTLDGLSATFGLSINTSQMGVVALLDDRAKKSREESVGSIESNSSTQEDISIDTLTVASKPTEEKPQTGPSVRRGGAVEGMEGGVDMNQLAKPPSDFNTYLTAQMKDSQFYSDKEIYKGQQTVDNVRALRGLGTDRLHQLMVESQYKESD